MNKLQTILNDEIGRRTEIARSGTKMSEQRSDAYGYNDRSELTNAVKEEGEEKTIKVRSIEADFTRLMFEEE